MAVIRFKLDLSQLDDTAYGLDGPSGRSFILDSSQLDGAEVLNGSPFLTTATASSSLGGLDANASATVTQFAVLSAPLGGLDANVSATVTQFAVLSAPLGGLDANASATVVQFAVLSAPLGGLDATAIAQAEGFPVFTATLGGLVAIATAGDIPVPEPTPSGGRRVYSTSPRKKIEPLPQVEIPVIQPKRRYAVASAILNGASCTATSSITFSILDDDAEILLLV
ncbi:MAG: hypothetical protein EBR82_30245 [Caulobacteraceae bacterium]|nr:hypothetical protein [Caulobacteraceae bacterium]